MSVLGVPVASSGATLGFLLGDFGISCALLGVTLGSLRMPLATVRPPWVPSWFLFEIIEKLPLQGGPKVALLIDVCSGIGGSEFIRGILGIRGIPGNGVLNYDSAPPLNLSAPGVRMT